MAEMAVAPVSQDGGGLAISAVWMMPFFLSMVRQHVGCSGFCSVTERLCLMLASPGEKPQGWP